MLEKDHTLILYRAPVYIEMLPVPEHLRFKLGTTKIVLNRQLDNAKNGRDTIRTVSELESELNNLERLQNQCIAVEHDFLDNLDDPTRPPEHGIGFDALADELEAYGSLFGRDDLFDESYLRGMPSPNPPGLPTQYQGRQVLRQLERAHPGLTNDFIAAHKVYLSKFRSSNRTKPTKTPMSELDYIEMRARFKLGMSAEEPARAAYNRITGMTIDAKNTFTIDILKRGSLDKERGRKPDLFKLGVVIGDFKNVDEQDYSEQMRDNFRIAQADEVRLSPGLGGGTRRVLVPGADETPRFDLVVRVPWHPRGGTKVDDKLESDIKAHGNKTGDVLELIDDPIE
jgi:hypothetical protein